MKIRLVRKLADYLDGVDVSQHQEGDILDLPAGGAGLLLAEGWAVPVQPGALRRAQGAVSLSNRARRRTRGSHRTPSSPLTRAEAAFQAKRRTIERLREEVGREIQQRQLDRQEQRRAEDLIREELHDSRAKTIR